jgi:hypothetical protein
MGGLREWEQSENTGYGDPEIIQGEERLTQNTFRDKTAHFASGLAQEQNLRYPLL